MSEPLPAVGAGHAGQVRGRTAGVVWASAIGIGAGFALACAVAAACTAFARVLNSTFEREQLPLGPRP